MNKTSLYDEHVRLNATMVPFAGYLMPLQYSSINHEHLQVRTDVGVFDVSHMGEILVEGPDSFAFVNHVLTNKMPPGPNPKAIYTLMCDEAGFIIDDLIVYPLEAQRYFLVVNASNTAKDFDWLAKQAATFEVTVTDVSAAYGQIAIQGPRAEGVLSSIFGTEAAVLTFMQFKEMTYDGDRVLLSRSGYTGEDGFEAYATPSTIHKLWTLVIEKYRATPCGLGARDTLRFEAALSLYGHEIDDRTTPLEAGLKFAVSFDKDFIGKAVLAEQLEQGARRKLVGLDIVGRGIARADYEVCQDERRVGKVTTGYLLPNHAHPLALAMVETACAAVGTELAVMIRNQAVKAVVRDIRFMDKKYKK